MGTRPIMTDLRITTTKGTSTALDEATVQGFKTSLRGPLLCPGDEGYDEARKVWNAMIDKRPALIVRCAGVADVIHAVNFARTNNLLVSVRGGGHNVAGTAVCVSTPSDAQPAPRGVPSGLTSTTRPKRSA